MIVTCNFYIDELNELVYWHFYPFSSNKHIHIYMHVTEWIIIYFNDGLLAVRTQQTSTHWGRDETATISQTTFSNAFSWMKMYEFRFRIHWSLFLKLKLTIFQHWFASWFATDPAISHYPNQWWLVYWRIYVSLGLNEVVFNQLIGPWCRHGASWGCCLMAPSLYLNQYLFTFGEVIWH